MPLVRPLVLLVARTEPGLGELPCGVPLPPFLLPPDHQRILVLLVLHDFLPRGEPGLVVVSPFAEWGDLVMVSLM